MRIVVSGTHASGKSTLIADVAAALPDYAVLPDPFELLDERFDQPGPAMFLQQLRAAADRLPPTSSPNAARSTSSRISPPSTSSVGAQHPTRRSSVRGR